MVIHNYSLSDKKYHENNKSYISEQVMKQDAAITTIQTWVMSTNISKKKKTLKEKYKKTN
jgi:hypothetical protein